MRNTHYALSSSMPLTVAGRRLTSHPSIVRSDWFNANQEGLLPLLRTGQVKAYSVDGVMRISRTALTFGSAASPSTVAGLAAPVAQAEVTVPDIHPQVPMTEAGPVQSDSVQFTENPSTVTEAEPAVAFEPDTVADNTAVPDEPAAPDRTYPQHSDDELLTWKTSELRKLCEDHGVELKTYDTTKSRIIEKWRAAAGAPQ